MTPKEKAKELLEKMISQKWEEYDPYLSAKKCALITVNQILQAINIESVDDEPYLTMKIININEYWEQVKTEIELL